MHLLQAHQEAKKMNVPKNHKIVFEMIDQGERALQCEWIDPKEGTFEVEGRGGFNRIEDHFTNDPPIQNQRVVEKGGK